MSTTGFQFYEGTATESADVPRITVRKGGVLVLTRAAVQMLGEGVTHVRIGFNPKTRAVGLQPAEGAGQGCYKLRGQRNSVSQVVDGKRVFKHHGLTVEKPRHFDAEDAIRCSTREE